MAINTTGNNGSVVGVTGVHPDNMGKGIKWNPATNQYEVALGDGLFINDDGLIQLKAIEPKIETFDNGTGVIKHRRAIIDYGGLIEVSGTIMLGLMSPDFAIGTSVSNAAVTAEINRLKSIYGQGFFAYRPDKVTSSPVGETGGVLYYVESGYKINVAEFGISKVISVSCTAGDILGHRRETAWVIGDITTLTTVVPIGIQVLFNEGQTECSVSYTIKGIKA